MLQKSAVAAGALTVGGATAGTVAGDVTDAGAQNGGKRGGRGQIDGTADRNRPFTLQPEGTDTRNATCMSGESAMQTYLTYSINYCDSNDDDSDGTFYVIPDEAPLVESETYVIRSIRPCRTNDLEKVAFGPAQTDC